MTRESVEILKLLDIDAKQVNESKFIHKVHFFELQPDVYISFCHFNVKNFSTILYKTFEINFPYEIESSVLKRQAEFLAGRLCAKNTLINSEVIEKQSDYILPIGKHRNPKWPIGIIGSITHTDNYAMCLAAKESKYKFIGLDSEKIMSLKQAAELKSTILDWSEQKYIQSFTIPLNVAITLAFSAKETLFKALYCYVGKYFDFDIAHLTNINLNNNQVSLSINREFAATYNLPNIFFLTFQIRNQNVLTHIIQ